MTNTLVGCGFHLIVRVVSVCNTSCHRLKTKPCLSLTCIITWPTINRQHNTDIPCFDVQLAADKQINAHSHARAACRGI